MICLQLLFVISLVGIAKGINNIVQTKDGPIRGKAVGSKGVRAFLGIPFAEPPVGSLRFAKPVAKAPWTDVRNATELPPPCIQARFGGITFYVPRTADINEDCLYLNLWVPKSRNAYDLKPIVIYIHGGLFMTGGTNMGMFDGTSLADYGDVIVATVNYRLGALGFFYGCDDDAAGNMAMYDQVESIRWIKENAYTFGGDPDNIVLVGHSYGAASVTAHLISPLSRNLFKRAILLSGSAIHPMYLDNNKRLLNMSQNYANLIGCAANGMTLEKNPKAIIECMRRLPAESFSDTDRNVFIVNKEYFFPRIGDSFLPESPSDSFRKGDFAKKEILLGITSNEGALFLGILMPLKFGLYGEDALTTPFNENLTRLILDSYINTGCDSVDDMIIQIYINRVNSEEGYTYLRAMNDAVGDYIISCGPIFQADFHSLRNDPVYFYMFDYRPPFTPMAEWAGVTHYEDIQYYFGNPVHSSNFTEYEKLLSRDVMDIWIAFINTGNPNTGRGLVWPRYSYYDPKYMVIGPHKRVDWSQELNRCENWRKIYRSVIDENVIRNLRDSEFAAEIIPSANSGQTRYRKTRPYKRCVDVPRSYEHPRQHFQHKFFRDYGTFKHFKFPK